MGRLNILGKFFILAAFAVASANAVAATQFTVSGTINSVTDHNDSTKSFSGGSFTALITYDSSVAIMTSNSGGTMISKWDQSIVSVKYQIKDSGGNVVVSSDAKLGDPTEPTSYAYTQVKDSSASQFAQWTIFNYNGSDTGDIANALFSSLPVGTLSSATAYPDPNRIVGQSGTFIFAYLRTGVYLSGSGQIDTVTVGPADSDDDGIPDDQDSCPNSDLSGMVTVNGYDTGVTNSLQPNGCTIMDLIANASSPRKMARVLDRLEDNGVITHRQMGKIERAAAKHHGQARAKFSWGSDSRDHHARDRDHHSRDHDRDHHSRDHDRDHHSRDHDGR